VKTNYLNQILDITFFIDCALLILQW